MHPRDFEILDVAGIDLIEAAVMVGFVGTVMRRPVVLGRLGIERSRVLGLRRRGGQYGSHRQRGAASKISCMKSHLYPPGADMFVGPRCRRDLCNSDVNASSGQGLDIDRMDRRNCRHQQTAALLSAEVIGRDFLQMTFFDEGAVVWMPFGACRHTPSSPGFTCPMLRPTLPAMSVRCTMTRPPKTPVLVDPDCCFFCEAQISRRDLEPKSPRLKLMLPAV